MRRRTFTGSAVAVAAGFAVPAVGAGTVPDAVGAPTDTAPDPTADPVTDLGEPVHKVQTLASAIGTTPDGVPFACYVVSGNENVTAEFTVVDLRSQQTLFSTRVPYGRSSQRALALSPVDGSVWFATSDIGHVYHYVHGADEVRHIVEIPNGELAWSMAVGEDDTVWFGTYPSGSLYSLPPDTRELVHHGQALAGEQYVDSIAPVGDTVHVGTQPNARMATLDRGTGAFTELAMPPGHSGTAVSALDVRGGKLFVSSTQLYVLDLASGDWVDTIPDADANVSPVDPLDPDTVYLRQAAEVRAYSLSTGQLTGTGDRPNATPESWGWVDLDGTGERPLLALTYWREGRTYGFAVHGGSGFYLVPDLMGAGAPLTALGTGPLGNVFAGAFLSPPGMGRYDPDGDGSIDLLAGTSQVEGFGTFDGRLVFGRYPQGSLYLYDPAQPWNSGSNPAAPLEIGDGQSRPQLFVELSDDPGTVAVGSVPVPGEHGGAITLWRPDDRTVEVHRHVVPDQTPVGLVLHNGMLYGGTSIQGGYGIDPVTDEAVLFAWDPKQRTTTWTTVAVPGAQTLSGLAIADDGHLWGIADGRTVFEFDLAGRALLRTVTIDPEAAIDRYGDNSRLLFDHGRLFGATADRLFVLDRVTGEVTSLYGRGSGRDDGVDSVYELTRDRHGDLYVVGRGTHLVRYALPADVTPPTVTVRTGRGGQDGGHGGGRGAAVWLQAEDDTDPAPRIQVRLDDGPWQDHDPDRMVLVRPGRHLRYRAVDAAWNASPVQTYTVR